MITVIVLAAGMSRRMGPENKLLLPVRGKTMLETTLGQIPELPDAEVVVVLGHEADKIRPLLENFRVKVAINSDYAHGMTSSIQAGVRAASEQASGFMICLSDMPLIPAGTYGLLAEVFLERVRSEPRLIVQPVFESRPGNPVIFSAAYKEDILSLDFPEGCKPLVRSNKQFVRQVEVETDAILRDIDTEEAFRFIS